MAQDGMAVLGMLLLVLIWHHSPAGLAHRLDHLQLSSRTLVVLMAYTCLMRLFWMAPRCIACRLTAIGRASEVVLTWVFQTDIPQGKYGTGKPAETRRRGLGVVLLRLW